MYTDRLGDLFGAHVMRYPVRTASGHVKYDLLFLTRHSSGLLAMNEVVYQVDRAYRARHHLYPVHREEQKARAKGQTLLFDSGAGAPPLAKQTDEEVAQTLHTPILACGTPGTRMTFRDIRERLLDAWFGQAQEKHVRAAVRQLEKQGRVDLDRRAIKDETRVQFS